MLSKSFPCLFPYGVGDLRYPRKHRIRDKEYFIHLFNYFDGRFAKDERFRYFAFNFISRNESRKNGTFFIKKNKLDNLSVSDLIGKLNFNSNYGKNILSMNSKLRGSSPYWYLRSRELTDMINQLGVPHLFFTFSAADLQWPEIYKKLDPDFDYDNSSNELIYKRRLKILRKYPKEFAIQFHFRFKIFFEKIFLKRYNIIDYWYRIEFQGRGSPHVHGVAWIKNGLRIEDLKPNSSKELVEKYRNFYDSILSCENPLVNNNLYNLNEKNPTSYLYSDVGENEHLIDLNNLLNTTQKHTKCSEEYCLRMNKKSKKLECRYNYPKPLNELSSLYYDEDKEIWEYIPKRNDPYLNNYDRECIELWRANMDIQIITR